LNGREEGSSLLLASISNKREMEEGRPSSWRRFPMEGRVNPGVDFEWKRGGVIPPPGVYFEWKGDGRGVVPPPGVYFG